MKGSKWKMFLGHLETIFTGGLAAVIILTNLFKETQETMKTVLCSLGE